MQDVRLRGAGRSVALIGYAAVAALSRPLTLPAAVAVAVTAIALVILDAPPPATATGPLGRRHVAPWAVLMALFATWEATGAVWGNDGAHPTLSLLLDPVLATYPGRVIPGESPAGSPGLGSAAVW
jgi:hypothetical protein